MEWFYGAKEPITLVHGPFGTGKSFLLAVIIIFLDRLLSEDENKEIRMLVCSSTNTAVDRVLLGLLNHGFTDFARIGSLKKIAKPLLPYTQTSEERLKNIRVFGVTCAASMFPILDNCEFPLVFLDECSQMLEPSSLIPLNRFRCQRLLGVGDPLQLPPVNSFGGSEGYGKTFFVRLAETGFEPHLLRTQYRVTFTVSPFISSLF